MDGRTTTIYKNRIEQIYRIADSIYRKRCIKTDITRDDVRSWAKLGFMEALRRWDEKNEKERSTHIEWKYFQAWIKGACLNEIKTYFKKNSFTLIDMRNYNDFLYKAKQKARKLFRDRDTYTEDMLNHLFDVIEEVIDKHFNGTIYYLSETTNEYTRPPDAIVMNKIDWEKAMESLTQAQRDIITACDLEGKTQQEVAAQRHEEKWRVVRQRLDAFATIKRVLGFPVAKDSSTAPPDEPKPASDGKNEILNLLLESPKNASVVIYLVIDACLNEIPGYISESDKEGVARVLWELAQKELEEMAGYLATLATEETYHLTKRLVTKKEGDDPAKCKKWIIVEL